MGGLNRILDNKIILATLTHYAPKYFSKKVTKAGLDNVEHKIMPPQTLPPTEKSDALIDFSSSATIFSFKSSVVSPEGFTGAQNV